MGAVDAQPTITPYTTFLAKAVLLLAWHLVGLHTPPLYAEEATDPVVIAHPSVPAQDISIPTLRTMFGMRLRNWSDGSAVKVFVMNDHHPLHEQFSKRVLGMFPHQLRSAWDRLVFSGTGQEPTLVSTFEEMREKVATTPGAIGYVRRSQLDDSVKTLRIQ